VIGLAAAAAGRRIIKYIPRHRSVEMYDATRNQWFPLPDLNSPRSDLGLVNLNNHIYAIGGFTGTVNTKFKERLVAPY
jgi:hypothetical protein